MNLSAANAEDYLRARGDLAPGERVQARELSGGVSNCVIHITRSGGDDLVLKQAREKLNVAEPWYCSVDRIWREAEVLRHCERLVDQDNSAATFKIEVPRLLFEDRAHYLYAMSAAPPDHAVWKHELLSGVARPEIARSCGTLLGTLHAGTWHDNLVARELDDRQYFDQLRLDPYYRQVARVHADLAPAIERLIESAWSERHSLVHGDFSPKNLLIFNGRLMLIDFEVGHYGDPAFDLGFFVSHLILKAFHRPAQHIAYLELIDAFWRGYLNEMSLAVSSQELSDVTQRGILHFAGCALARLDGKSKVDYLQDEALRCAVRELCRTVFAEQPPQWADVKLLAGRAIAKGRTHTDS